MIMYFSTLQAFLVFTNCVITHPVMQGF